MWFNINWYILISELLPTVVRKPVLKAYLLSITSPIVVVYNRWLNNRRLNIYKLSHTGQIFSLQKLLNDALDSQLRRIYIADGDNYIRPYIYLESENQPVYLGTMHLHSADNYVDTGVDFKVYAPAEVIASGFYELKSLVDFYKLDVKRYSINPIN